jgi:hypothetical protein
MLRILLNIVLTKRQVRVITKVSNQDYAEETRKREAQRLAQEIRNQGSAADHAAASFRSVYLDPVEPVRPKGPFDEIKS